MMNIARQINQRFAVHMQDLLRLLFVDGLILMKSCFDRSADEKDCKHDSEEEHGHLILLRKMRSSSINSSRRFESQRMIHPMQTACQQQVIDLAVVAFSTLTLGVMM